MAKVRRSRHRLPRHPFRIGSAFSAHPNVVTPTTERAVGATPSPEIREQMLLASANV